MRYILTAAMLLIPMALHAEGQPVRIVQERPEGLPGVGEVRAITSGPKHHFFGYYGISPWDGAGKRLVCLQSDFGEGEIDADDVATIVLIDLESGKQRKIGDTRTWNFQQGCMMHWLGTDPSGSLVFNDRVEGEARAVVLDVASGDRRVLPRPVAAMSLSGTHAATLNFARLHRTRPGYGYAGVDDPWADDPHPKEDGIYLMDMATGETSLVVSIDAVYNAAEPPDAMKDKEMWLNHVLFSRDGQRLFFLGRFRGLGGILVTAAFTVGLNGEDLRCVIPYSWGASHFDWRNGEQMVVTSRYEAGKIWRHVLFTDGKDDHTVLAPDLLTRDGHSHFSYDGRWMITDTYPDRDRMQHLLLLDMKSRKAARIASFHQPNNFRGEWRCDLHPRWNADATAVCIDSTHDGSRQVYVVDLTATSS